MNFLPKLPFINSQSDDDLPPEMIHTIERVTSLCNQLQKYANNQSDFDTIALLCNTIKQFVIFMVTITQDLFKLSDPTFLLRSNAKTFNSKASNVNSTLAIVVNEKGEYPPHESSLISIKGIHSMTDDQVRECLQFYGLRDDEVKGCFQFHNHHDGSVNKGSLFKCLSVDMGRVIDDPNRRAKLNNTFVTKDEQMLHLLLNDIGLVPDNGIMDNGVKKLPLSTLRDPNNSDLDQLLVFYGLDYKYSSFDEKLRQFLKWLGYLVIREEREKEVLEVEKLKETLDKLIAENRSIKVELDEQLDIAKNYNSIRKQFEQKHKDISVTKKQGVTKEQGVNEDQNITDIKEDVDYLTELLERYKLLKEEAELLGIIEEKFNKN